MNIGRSTLQCKFYKFQWCKLRFEDKAAKVPDMANAK
jgi:hypothetical protein